VPHNPELELSSQVAMYSLIDVRRENEGFQDNAARL
jgi:hypothetical protein